MRLRELCGLHHVATTLTAGQDSHKPVIAQAADIYLHKAENDCHDVLFNCRELCARP